MYNVPLIFDIHRSSTADGPGLRTTVFLKGCNLDCYWCHNPEGKKPQMQTAYFKEKCMHCGACSDETSFEICPAQARKVYGRRYSAEELFDIIAKDKEYYIATGGGVTFSGGECMLYPEYLSKVARLCQIAGIKVAVDTAGNVPWFHFEQVLEVADLFLYDIKCLDDELHRQATGVSNHLILENLQRLIQSKKEIIVRTPLIPDFNMGKQVQEIQDYCNRYGLAWQGLNYHSYGEDKLKALENMNTVDIKL